MEDDVLLDEIRKLIFSAPRSGVTCPFCGGSDFDLIGLKNHLSADHCDAFNATLTLEQESAQRRATKEHA